MKTLLAFLMALFAVTPTVTPNYLPTIVITVQPTEIPFTETATLPAATPIATPTEQPIVQAYVVSDTPVTQDLWANVPTISYQEAQIVPTTDYSQWMGTPNPALLTPSAPGIQLNIDDLSDIDNLWDMFATPQAVPMGYLEQCAGQLPIPFVTWQMALEASLLDGPNSETIELPASTISNIVMRGGGFFPSEGTVILPENGLVSYMMTFPLNICQDVNGKPNVYGPGVQMFLNDLAQNYLIDL